MNVCCLWAPTPNRTIPFRPGLAIKRTSDSFLFVPVNCPVDIPHVYSATGSGAQHPETGHTAGPSRPTIVHAAPTICARNGFLAKAAIFIEAAKPHN